eukprot:GGOE01005086.1.p1 GENE.GGOE01005086.1~~GGOE01005086.1.p1  ORF type:complete len:154 (+),score=4.51 GGOE01005086.1:196-657(+)
MTAPQPEVRPSLRLEGDWETTHRLRLHSPPAGGWAVRNSALASAAKQRHNFQCSSDAHRSVFTWEAVRQSAPPPGKARRTGKGGRNCMGPPGAGDHPGYDIAASAMAVSSFTVKACLSYSTRIRREQEVHGAISSPRRSASTVMTKMSPQGHG